jgi:hypothetical protein
MRNYLCITGSSHLGMVGRFDPVGAVAIRRVASALIASQTVCQETPSWWARAETEVSKRCSPSVAHATALAVSFARGPANSCSSVNVVLGLRDTFDGRLSAGRN